MPASGARHRSEAAFPGFFTYSALRPAWLCPGNREKSIGERAIRPVFPAFISALVCLPDRSL